MLKEAGTTSVTGSILIPSEKINAEQGVKMFPSVNVSGNWQNTKEDGSGTTPVTVHGAIPILKTYEHKYPASSPN